MVHELSWSDDVFEEKSGLLARVSYLAWLYARRSGRYAEVTTWEDLTAKHANEQGSVQGSLASLASLAGIIGPPVGASLFG
jgi:hypothetical protein